MQDFSTNFDAYNKLAISKINDENEEEYNIQSISSNGNFTNSIFSDYSTQTAVQNEDLNSLYSEFQSVQEEQGFIGKLWNGFKNLTGLGLSSNDVEDKIEQYENGEITYDEALDSIQTFETKQEGMVDLAANTVSGIVTGAITLGTGGFGIGAGAALGGAVKAGIKTADRATNEVEGDAVDLKQITKDVVTGAVDGAVNVATAGMFDKVAKAGQTVGQAVKNGIKAGAVSGALSGAAGGAASYTVEAAVEEDVDFSFSDFASSTIQNAAAGAAMGSIMGGVTGGIKQNSMNNKQAAINAEAKARTEAQTQAELKAQEAQDYYNKQFDDALSNKSAEESAAVFKESDLTDAELDQIRAEANEKINNGTSYEETKNEATKNLNHDQKKQVKDAVGEVREEKLNAENALNEKKQNLTEEINKKSAEYNSNSQGIKNLDADELDKNVEAFKKNAEDAKANAEELRKIADENPTNENIKRARRAENKAAELEANANKYEAKAEAQKAKLEEQQNTKAKNIEKQRSSENYDAGQQKMQENAKKTQTKANSNEKWYNKNTARKNAYNKLQNCSDEELQKISKSSKYGAQEKKVAERLLADRASNQTSLDALADTALADDAVNAKNTESIANETSTNIKNLEEIKTNDTPEAKVTGEVTETADTTEANIASSNTNTSKTVKLSDVEFNNGKATVDGENFSGTIEDTLNNGDTITMTYENGKITNSIRKGEVNVEKIYQGEPKGLEDRYITAFYLDNNGKRTSGTRTFLESLESCSDGSSGTSLHTQTEGFGCIGMPTGEKKYFNADFNSNGETIIDTKRTLEGGLNGGSYRKILSAPDENGTRTVTEGRFSVGNQEFIKKGIKKYSIDADGKKIEVSDSRLF